MATEMLVLETGRVFPTIFVATKMSPNQEWHNLCQSHVCSEAECLQWVSF